MANKLFKFEYAFSYEPELHPGVTYRIKDPKATLKIFSTGSITVTGKLLCLLKTHLLIIIMQIYEMS